jgi:hypothetical protein
MTASGASSRRIDRAVPSATPARATPRAAFSGLVRLSPSTAIVRSS